MITNAIIQAWIDKANLVGTDVMRWSDWISVFEDQLRNPTTTELTPSSPNIVDLPEYADEAAATIGALNGGDLYRTATGEVRVKLADD